MERLNIPPHIIPVYAEEVKVNAGIKMNIAKDNAGKEIVQKQGRVELLFLDNATKSVVSRIVIDPITAMQLSKILATNTEAVMKECDSKDVPPAVKQQIKKQQEEQNVTTSPKSYIG